MKNENEFNAYLGKEFRKLRPEVMHVKASDRFAIGVNDFILWRDGMSVVVECKFVKSFPERADNLILKHVFTGPQLTFAKLIMQTKTPAFGLIAEDARKWMVIFSSAIIPPNGNMSASYLVTKPNAIFNFNQVDKLTQWLFDKEDYYMMEMRGTQVGKHTERGIEHGKNSA